MWWMPPQIVTTNSFREALASIAICLDISDFFKIWIWIQIGKIPYGKSLKDVWQMCLNDFARCFARLMGLLCWDVVIILKGQCWLLLLLMILITSGFNLELATKNYQRDRIKDVENYFDNNLKEEMDDL